MTANMPVDAAGRRIKKAGEPPLARIADKDVTDLQQAFTDFIFEQTGYEADAKSVALGSILRGQFQKSEGNQARMADRTVLMAAEAETRETNRVAREGRKEAAAAAKAAKALEPKVEKVVKAPVAKVVKAKPAPKAKLAPKVAVAKAASKAKETVARGAAAAAKPAPRRRPSKPAPVESTTDIEVEPEF